jgi:predicted Fe-Mo cluster-binding NifX family protein
MVVSMVIILMFQPLLRGEEKAANAVASEGETLEDSVSPIAARCPYFLIVDDKGNLLEALENPYKDTRGGVGVSAANFLAEKNVTVFVAGKIGNKMKDALKAHEIDYFEFEGTVEEAVKKIREK